MFKLIDDKKYFYNQIFYLTAPMELSQDNESLLNHDVPIKHGCCHGQIQKVLSEGLTLTSFFLLFLLLL